MSNKQIKIDFLINKMTAGGAERVISILANYLCQDPDYRIRIVTFQDRDAYDLDPRIKRIRLHRIFFFRSVVFNGIFNLLWFYRKRKNRPDIMSSHIDLLGYLTIPVSIIYRIPIVVSEHNNHKANNSLWQSFLWNYLYKFPRCITILTAYDLEFFKTKNKKVVVMPNPCAFPIFHPPKDHQRKREILTIGNLNRYHQKGFDNLIPIIAKVLPYFSDWNLKIIGGGEEGMDYLKGLTKEYNLEDRVEFMGIRNDVQDLLRNAEIFMLPSRFEGLPMVLLEAMSQGIACIAYDCVSGPADVITNQENGTLVPDQEHSEMVSSLRELISNSELRQKFQMNAPKAMTKFSIEHVGGSWKELLQTMK